MRRDDPLCGTESSQGLFAGLTGGCELQVDKRVAITFVIGDVRFELRHTM